jgi:geranylgeranyl pyrophosphate synthase
MNIAQKAEKSSVTGDIRRRIIDELGLAREIDRLESMIAEWIESCDEELRDLLQWQFLDGAKYFRPATVFGCHRALHRGPCGDDVFTSAMIIEILHNMTLIVDDILDKSRYRRQKLTLHCRFGSLPALMTSGYVVAESYRMARTDPFVIDLITELIERLGVAECMQWRLRQQPLGLEDWRRIAGEDTGSMFEVCACLGGRGERLRRYGRLLGLLYHGCDDVADVRGVEALGGGGEEDIRDGILTLPASLAIRNPDVAARFCNPKDGDIKILARAFEEKLPEAEQCLDEIAEDARKEAARCCDDPAGLLALIDHTRQLSA